jgi:hypothetical protein
MAALVTVADYILEARVLLQDTVPPYRYPDDDLVTGINLAMAEIDRLRPDIFLDAKYTTSNPPRSLLSVPTPPTYSSAAEATVVPLPPQYKVSVIYYIAGNAQLRDTEDVTDKRASEFLNKFTAQLLTVEA